MGKFCLRESKRGRVDDGVGFLPNEVNVRRARGGVEDEAKFAHGRRHKMILQTPTVWLIIERDRLGVDRYENLVCSDETSLSSLDTTSCHQASSKDHESPILFFLSVVLLVSFILEALVEAARQESYRSSRIIGWDESSLSVRAL